jgi:peptidyl-prolyl cis-trans isomerase A (cyclophilin A)
MRHFSLVFTAGILAIAQIALAGGVTTPQTSSHPAHRPIHPALPPVQLPAEPGLYAVIYTSMGDIVCRLFPKDAPKAVANFRELAAGTKLWTDPRTGRKTRRPLYSGTIFHRVIPQFMIQGGDPLGTGSGDPGYKFPDEFSPEHTFDKPGMLAMANSGPDTNGSQFFITVAPTPWLNGKHTIFGEVVSGQDVADKISEVPRNGEDKPDTPVKIIRIVVRTVRATTPETTAATAGTTAKKP